MVSSCGFIYMHFYSTAAAKPKQQIETHLSLKWSFWPSTQSVMNVEILKGFCNSIWLVSLSLSLSRSLSLSLSWTIYLSLTQPLSLFLSLLHCFQLFVQQQQWFACLLHCLADWSSGQQGRLTTGMSWVQNFQVSNFLILANFWSKSLVPLISAGAFLFCDLQIGKLLPNSPLKCSHSTKQNNVDGLKRK